MLNDQSRQGKPYFSKEVINKIIQPTETKNTNIDTTL